MERPVSLRDPSQLTRYDQLSIKSVRATNARIRLEALRAQTPEERREAILASINKGIERRRREGVHEMVTDPEQKADHLLAKLELDNKINKLKENEAGLAAKLAIVENAIKNNPRSKRAELYARAIEDEFPQPAFTLRREGEGFPLADENHPEVTFEAQRARIEERRKLQEEREKNKKLEEKKKGVIVQVFSHIKNSRRITYFGVEDILWRLSGEEYPLIATRLLQEAGKWISKGSLQQYALEKSNGQIHLDNLPNLIFLLKSLMEPFTIDSYNSGGEISYSLKNPQRPELSYTLVPAEESQEEVLNGIAIYKKLGPLRFFDFSALNPVNGKRVEVDSSSKLSYEFFMELIRNGSNGFSIENLDILLKTSGLDTKLGSVATYLRSTIIKPQAEDFLRVILEEGKYFLEVKVLNSEENEEWTRVPTGEKEKKPNPEVTTRRVVVTEGETTDRFRYLQYDFGEGLLVTLPGEILPETFELFLMTLGDNFINEEISSYLGEQFPGYQKSLRNIIFDLNRELKSPQLQVVNRQGVMAKGGNYKMNFLVDGIPQTNVRFDIIDNTSDVFFGTEVDEKIPSKQVTVKKGGIDKSNRLIKEYDFGDGIIVKLTGPFQQALFEFFLQKGTEVVTAEEIDAYLKKRFPQSKNISLKNIYTTLSQTLNGYETVELAKPSSNQYFFRLIRDGFPQDNIRYNLTYDNNLSHGNKRKLDSIRPTTEVVIVNSGELITNEQADFTIDLGYQTVTYDLDQGGQFQNARVTTFFHFDEDRLVIRLGEIPSRIMLCLISDTYKYTGATNEEIFNWIVANCLPQGTEPKVLRRALSSHRKALIQSLSPQKNQEGEEVIINKLTNEAGEKKERVEIQKAALKVEQPEKSIPVGWEGADEGLTLEVYNAIQGNSPAHRAAKETLFYGRIQVIRVDGRKRLMLLKGGLYPTPIIDLLNGMIED